MPPAPPQPAETIKTLAGHSGCAVTLCRREGFYFVRKISPSPDYNARLERQADKQVTMANLLPVPRVLARGSANGLAYYDMEYVAGSDFASYCTQQNLAALNGIADTIARTLESFAINRSGEVDPQSFKTKVATVSDAARRHRCYGDHSKALDALWPTLADADWSAIPRTVCHGDFTLENIIFRDGGDTVFIDLLDGELESFWMDVAKLQHDLETGWSLRRLLWTAGTSQEARFLAMVSRYLAEELATRIAAAFPDIGPRLAQLRALQASRVLPYVEDSAVFARLVDGLRRLH